MFNGTLVLLQSDIHTTPLLTARKPLQFYNATKGIHIRGPGPGFDPRARQEKEVPMNTLVCSCGSVVELLSALRSLSGG